MKKNNNLLIIDAYGFVFRAFYIQPRLTNPEGVPINAVYGFTSMLIKLLNDFESRNIVIVFDGGGKNFRHALYPDYKAHRPPIPEDLRVQLPLVRKVAESLNISMLECYGVEADDIIATVAHKANLEGKLATIVSPDKDLTQLINHNINVYDPVKNKFVDADEVFNKFGVQPNQVRDYLAIVGDAADNIPGVSGVGPKGAADLLNQFGSLSNIWDNLHNIASAKRKENLVNSKEAALLSWELVGLRQIDVDFELANFAWQAPEKDLILSFLNEFGFKSLVVRIEKLCGFSINEEKAPGKLNLIDIDSLELLDKKISNIIQVGWVSLRIDLNKIYFTSNNIEILIM
jgi:DNA polymerase-1